MAYSKVIVIGLYSLLIFQVVFDQLKKRRTSAQEAGDAIALAKTEEFSKEEN